MTADILQFGDLQFRRSREPFRGKQVREQVSSKLHLIAAKKAIFPEDGFGGAMINKRMAKSRRAAKRPGTAKQ